SIKSNDFASNNLGGLTTNEILKRIIEKLNLLGDDLDASIFKNLQKYLSDTRFGILKNIKFRFTDDPDILINIGDVPVTTCQSIQNDDMEENEKVDDLLAEGLAQIVTAQDENGRIIGRAITTLAEDINSEDNPYVLFIDLSGDYTLFGNSLAKY